MRVRRFTGRLLKNFYLLVIPMRTCHTGLDMFNELVKLFQAVVGDRWNQKVGIATGGEASIVGKVADAVTRLEQMMRKGLYRVWCGARQLDLVVKTDYDTVATIFQYPLYS